MKNGFSKEFNIFIDKHIANQANNLDTESIRLKKIFKKLHKEGFSSITMIKRNPVKLLRYNIFLARNSGALAFLHHQNAVALNNLLKSDNFFLKEKYLSKMLAGKLFMGNALSSLRYNKAGIIGNLACDHYQLSGCAYWVTGYKIFDHLLIGFKDTFGSKYFTVINFAKSKNVHISDPKNLIALNSTNTVSIELRNVMIPKEKVIACVGELSRDNPKLNISRQLNICAFLMGTVYKIMEIIGSSLTYIKKPKLIHKYVCLNETLRSHFGKIIYHYLLSNNMNDFLKFKKDLLSHVSSCLFFGLLWVNGVDFILTRTNLCRLYNEARLFFVLLR